MGEDFHPSVRLNDAEQRKLLEGIRAHRQSVEESNRAHERIECHLTNIPIVVTHPDGDIARFLVCTRNISAGGLAFLHGGFLYPGCKCEITLPTVWGAQEKISGSIVTCRHIEKHIHEFSLSFEALIDRRRFVTLPGERPLESELDNTKIAALSGRVLVIDECKVNTDLAQHHIKNSTVEMTAAETMAEGVEAIRSQPFETVILDIDSPGKPARELITILRDAGHKGPLVCATVNPDSEEAHSAAASGADEVVMRPIPASNLVRVLTECLSGNSAATGPVRCQLEANADTAELINNYLNYIDDLAGKITESIESEDLESLRKSCRVISQSASGYGYPPLETAANNALRALNASESVESALSELQRLKSICTRLEPMKLG